MPKIVDHNLRREEIARLAVQVIQQAGAEGATVRRIARAGNFSIGVLSHYFSDKDELLSFAFQWLAARTFAELRAATAAQPPGLPRLRTALEFMLPAPRASSYIAVWLAFWGSAVRNPALARAHSAYYARWRRSLGRHLEEAVRERQIARLRSARDATDLLAAGIDGLWLGAAFEPGRFSVRRRRELVDCLLGAVIGGRRA
jgi:AcrR family transcriptional regulator